MKIWDSVYIYIFLYNLFSTEFPFFIAILLWKVPRKKKVVKTAAEAVAGKIVLTLKRLNHQLIWPSFFGQVLGWRTNKKNLNWTEFNILNGRFLSKFTENDYLKVGLYFMPISFFVPSGKAIINWKASE